MLKLALGKDQNPERKRILYTGALARQFWEELPWVCRMTTELCERRADGEFDESVLGRPLEYIAEGAYLCAQYARNGDSWVFPSIGLGEYERYLVEAGFAKPPDADQRAKAVGAKRLRELTWLVEAVATGGMPLGRDMHSVPLLRDIFANPFRPFAFGPAWRSDTVVSLARGISESRDFATMPILADALQDTGCDNADILNHCRDDQQVHVRGCWVIDLVLGKA